ncbi:MAG: recombinase family protein [Candidatus Andersenbacteria bacterium]|nr:recombinase family protein [Candidatus Andersenbacteria bacterium]
MIDPKIVQKSYICTYARKSEEDKYKQVQSIPDQLKINQQIADFHEIKIPAKHVYMEEMSAGEPGRPVFNQLIETIQKNTHTILVCWHFNRLTRNPIDEGVLKWLLQKGKLTIITPNQVFDQNTNVIITSVEGAQGNQFLIELSRNVIRGLNSKRAKGVPSGVAPAGYRNGGTEKGNKWFEPDDGDPNRFLLVQDALKLVINGIEPMDAFRRLNDDWKFLTIKRKRHGGTPISKSVWYEMLRNPIYCGQFIALDEWHEVKDPHFKPMITEEEYWELQSKLGVKGRTRPKLQDEEQAAFLQALTCGECGNKMSRDRKRQIRCLCKHKYSALHRDTCPMCGLHESKVPSDRKHTYDFYFCPTGKKKQCSQPTIPTEAVESQIATVLDSVSIPQEFIDWAMAYLETKNDEVIVSREARLQSLQKAYKESEEELNRMNRLYIKGGFEHEGGDEEYQKMKREQLSKKKALQKQLSEFDTSGDNWRERTEGGYDFCKEALTEFTLGSYRTKRGVLLHIYQKATVQADKVRIDIELPFQFMKNKMHNLKTKFGLTEPGKIEELLRDTGKQEDIDAVKKFWLPG